MKWKPGAATSQRIVNKAWGLRDYKQPDIAEEIVRGYNVFREAKPEFIGRPATVAEEIDYASRNSFRANEPKRNCESVCSKRTEAWFEPDLIPASSPKSSQQIGLIKLRPMSEPVRGKR